MVKVWVSGAWIHKKEVGKKLQQLRELGYEITHDWTIIEKSNHPNETDLGNYAKFDIDGVIRSDVAIAIMDDPKYAYRGTFSEIGCALGVGKPLHIVCPFYDRDNPTYSQTNVFFWHPDIIHHKNFESVIEHLKLHYPVDNEADNEIDNQ